MSALTASNTVTQSPGTADTYYGKEQCYRDKIPNTVELLIGAHVSRDSRLQDARRALELF